MPRDTATVRLAIDEGGPLLAFPAPLASVAVSQGNVMSGPGGSLGVAPSVMSAEASLSAATQGVTLQRRSIFQLPSLNVGFETGDPDMPGLLPTFGVTIPITVLLMGYLIGQIGGLLPLPGGVGGIDGGLIGTLIVYGAPAAATTAAVLAYRVILFWVPLLMGAAAFVSLRRNLARAELCRA